MSAPAQTPMSDKQRRALARLAPGGSGGKSGKDALSPEARHQANRQYTPPASSGRLRPSSSSAAGASSSSAAAAPTGPQESGSEEDQSSEDSEGEWSAPDFASDVSSSEWTGGSDSESDSWSDSGGGAGVDSNDDDGHEFDGYRLVDMDNLAEFLVATGAWQCPACREHHEDALREIARSRRSGAAARKRRLDALPEVPTMTVSEKRCASCGRAAPYRTRTAVVPGAYWGRPWSV